MLIIRGLQDIVKQKLNRKFEGIAKLFPELRLNPIHLCSYVVFLLKDRFTFKKITRGIY